MCAEKFRNKWNCIDNNRPNKPLSTSYSHSARNYHKWLVCKTFLAVDLDKENGAHEEFDNPIAQNAVPELGFGENENIKFADKQDKKLNNGHRDKNINKEDQELQNDVQLEENEEDGNFF